MNIYGPNEDRPRFYEELKSQMSQLNVDFIILGGDLNLVMNPALDSLNYVADNNTRAKEAFRDLCYSFNLVDVWRHYNPNDRKYTWLRRTPFKAGRLDMFFLSEDLVHNLFDIDITPGYRTDHSAITMSIKRKHKRGSGLWKFNISHLSDDNYIKTIRSCTIDTICQYPVPLYTERVFRDHKLYESLQLTIRDTTFYETLIMLIRGETVKYSKQKSRRLRAAEKNLISEINSAESMFMATRPGNQETTVKRPVFTTDTFESELRESA